MTVAAPIRELDGTTAANAFARVADLDEPAVFRGLVAEWPLVRAAQTSDKEVDEYLMQFYGGQPVTVFTSEPGVDGRIFYTDELERVNFAQSKKPFDWLLKQLRLHAKSDPAPTLYMGSTFLDHFFPGIGKDNSLPRAGLEPTVRIWIGNRTTVAAHYDAMDNIACVCAGRRRFTLFPPEQIENLYVGPIDFTPAGQAVSLVDFGAPDLARFPRFEEAMKHARSALLEPGDALFIPAMWWHHVEGLENFNILVNHWWKTAPAHVGPPLDALLHALLNIRDLPPTQRSAWQVIFNHYIFDDPESAAAHIPEHRRGALGKIDGDMARKIRAALRNNLNR